MKHKWKEAKEKLCAEERGIPWKVKVDHSKRLPRVRLEFVKKIQNGLKKKYNLIESTPFRAEFGLGGKENEVRIHKEE